MKKIQVTTSFYFYLASYIFGFLALLALEFKGLSFYFAPISAFGIIPILELFLKPNKDFFQVKNPLLNNITIVLIAPFHIYILIKYLLFIQAGDYSTSEWIGALATLGLLCGVYGINVAHELGHRKQKGYHLVAQALLLTSLYQHFFIEHNRGHHKRVGTFADAATARKNEAIYVFWIRCVVQSVASAFNLEKQRLNKLNKHWLSPNNLFVRFLLLEAITLLAIYLFIGVNALVFFVFAAIIGFLLLESINYVEHYGLFRKEIHPDVFERVNASHSWNSDHVLGRFLLFELSRHSHHHENASREYYELESMPKARDLPTGYPGSIILALIPPLFFKIMNAKIEA